MNEEEQKDKETHPQTKPNKRNNASFILDMSIKALTIQYDKKFKE
jgi:hypothetical protein